MGANGTDDRSDLIAWGETEPKKSGFDWDNYLLTSNDSYNGMTKYCNRNTYGAVDNKLTIEAENDAATANWGSNWRMPSREDIQELIDGCTWKNGIGTSKANGNKIQIENIWLAEVSAAKCFNAYYWDHNSMTALNEQRCKGMCVRGVTTAEGVAYKTYMVNFFTADSTLIESQQVEAGKTARKVEAPAIAGLNFTGWSDSTFTHVTGDMNTYAQYAQKVFFTVNFYGKDSVLVESQKVEKGQAANTVPTPVVPDFIFTTWSDSSFSNVKGNIDVYAEYKPAISISGVYNGNSYVDLGLESGLVWATYNIGAKASSETGDLFAWGETGTKESYSWDNYKWGSKGKPLKYNTNPKNGVVDNKTILDPEDDAATANMGENWHMPTVEEANEMIETCDWEWVQNFCNTQTNGWLGTSKKNGNTIFIPNNNNYYWTAYSNYVDMAFALAVKADGINAGISEEFRYKGSPVRAVADSKKSYTIKFFTADSTLIDSQIVKEGSSATAATAPEWKGHVFTGWSDSSFTSVKADLNIYAVYREKYKFKVNFYSVTDSSQTTAKLIGTQVVEEGGDANEQDVPKVFGLKFTGWDAPLTNIQNDTDLHAIFSRVTVYTVTFHTIDSVAFKSVQAEEGDDVTGVSAPVMSYEAFVKWSQPITNVSSNLNVYPIYEKALSNSGAIDGYEYVDLGLDSEIKWATYNVGASQPTQYGNYFAWGETEPKKEYSQETYKWFDGTYEKIIKYNTSAANGTLDRKTRLEPADDAATVNWGKSWRIPTSAEIQELINACEWKTVKNFLGSSVNGWLGTSKANGNTIFLPSAGIFNWYDTNYEGENAFYWSSDLSTNLYEDTNIGARDLSTLLKKPQVSYAERDYGQSVRAVSE